MPGMNDPLRYPTSDAHDDEPSTRTPRWVYFLWAAGILLLVLFVVLHLTGVMGPGAH